MVEFGTYSPFVSGTTSFIPGPMPQPNNCISIGKVHHFHEEIIECSKTINKTDLPTIQVCCRCQFEQEIQPRRYTPTARTKGVSKFEKVDADQTMRIYNEKRNKRLQEEVLKFANSKA